MQWILNHVGGLTFYSDIALGGWGQLEGLTLFIFKIWPIAKAMERYLTTEEVNSIVSAIKQVPSPVPQIGERVTAAIRAKLAMQLYSRPINPNIVNGLRQAVEHHFQRALISPGEHVGLRTGESVSQQFTQGVLNVFHSSGAAKTISSSGIESFQEIFRASAHRKREIATLHFTDKNLSFDQVYAKRAEFVGVTLSDIIASSSYFDVRERPWWVDQAHGLPHAITRLGATEWAKIGSYLNTPGRQILIIRLNRNVMYTHRLTTYDVARACMNQDDSSTCCVYAIPGPTRSTSQDGPCICVLPNVDTISKVISSSVGSASECSIGINPTAESDVGYFIMFFEQVFFQRAKDITLKGVTGIRSLEPVTIPVFKTMVRNEALNEGGEGGEGTWTLWINEVAMATSGLTLAKLFSLLEAANIQAQVVPPDERDNQLRLHVRVLEPNWQTWTRVWSLAGATDISGTITPSAYIYARSLFDDRVKAHAEYVYAVARCDAYDAKTGRLRRILGRPGIDQTCTISNNPHDIIDALGIEACRNYITFEIHSMLAGNDIYISSRFITMIADFMTNLGVLLPITSRGVARQKRGVLADASFERPTDLFVEAAMSGRWERTESTSGCIFLGKRASFGTGSFQVEIDPLFRDTMKRRSGAGVGTSFIVGQKSTVHMAMMTYAGGDAAAEVDSVFNTPPIGLAPSSPERVVPIPRLNPLSAYGVIPENGGPPPRRQPIHRPWVEAVLARSASQNIGPDELEILAEAQYEGVASPPVREGVPAPVPPFQGVPGPYTLPPDAYD
jgi:hypothetical protein